MSVETTRARALAQAVATYEAQMHLMCIAHAAGLRTDPARPVFIQPLCQLLTNAWSGGHQVAQALMHAHAELAAALNASAPGTGSERIRERRENMANGLGLVRQFFLRAAAA